LQKMRFPNQHNYSFSHQFLPSNLALSLCLPSNLETSTMEPGVVVDQCFWRNMMITTQRRVSRISG
jgi:hypothetical protein